ncbi:hypothetical protein PILCRDRAFT_72830 [Piloderma croceum F 1598]|uniref:BTB domain-containing protein n=1 Tax=Piloderma croceum (strain F 1598) TaxID=765440 RepID=A0A0C3BTZ2_PILCF|nr:hypothetical protein PILCRDRAFT_72830 [Piloderma croceum F 1598]
MSRFWRIAQHCEYFTHRHRVFSPPYQLHNEEIVNHLYNAGFQTGNYADTILHVHQNSYRLHAIILSRSPFLAHLMSTSPQSGGQRIIYVHLEHEPEVTQEGFAIALGYLYSAVSLSLISPENARGVLAAGCLLGGMDDLCGYSYETCKRSMNVDTIAEWLKFVDSPPTSNGMSPTDMHSTSVFGIYAQRLRDDIFNYLVVTLPNLLEVHFTSTEPGLSQGASGRDTLLRVFSLVPFDMFKTAVESPTFQIGSDQARFKFAKDAIELRRRARGSGAAEETVVLAFGGGNYGGSAVHITKKMKKRPLWKVNA